MNNTSCNKCLARNLFYTFYIVCGLKILQTKLIKEQKKHFNVIPIDKKIGVNEFDDMPSSCCFCK